jgi:hypothetical protein
LTWVFWGRNTEDARIDKTYYSVEANLVRDALRKPLIKFGDCSPSVAKAALIPEQFMYGLEPVPFTFEADSEFP